MATVPIVIILASTLGISFAAASALMATWDAEGAADSVRRLLDRIRSAPRDEAALGRSELLSFAQGTLTSAGLAAVAEAEGINVAVLERELAAARGGLTAPGDISSVIPEIPSAQAQESQAGALEALGRTLAGVLGGAGVGSLAVALTSSLTNTAEAREHNALGARYKSQSGFPGALFEQVRRFLPEIAAGTFVFAQSDMRNLLFGDVDAFLDSQLDPARFPGPASEENAQELAAQRIREAVNFGRKAALLAFSLEALTPMKALGFTQYAGLMASFAGFDRIAAGLMGTVENAAIYTPLRWRANRRFRPTIPQDQAVGLFYAKKEITPSQLADTLARNGLSDFWISVNASAMFLDPRLGEIVRIGQFYQPRLTPELAQVPNDVRSWWQERQEWVDIFASYGVAISDLLGPDWYFYYKLAKGGYEPADVLVLVQVAKRATTRREQSLFFNIATRLYRDGFVADEEFMAMVDEGWDFTDPKAARLRAAQLQARMEELQDYKALVLRSVSRGILTSAAGRQRLLDVGIRPERVNLDLLGERLGLIPRLSVVPGADPTDLLEEVEV